MFVFSRQHLRDNVAFSDVYELKEEVGQTTTSVCRRCLHRVTAVEYSVKVARHSQHSSFKYNRTISSSEYTVYDQHESQQPSRLDFKHKTQQNDYLLFVYIEIYNRLFILSDNREGEERPIRGD